MKIRKKKCLKNLNGVFCILNEIDYKVHAEVRE